MSDFVRRKALLFGVERPRHMSEVAMDIKFMSVGLLLAAAAQARAPADEEDLAEAPQNPIARLINVPLQNNMGFNYGKAKTMQNVLNIQPLIPFRLSQGWSFITRTIIPLISQPGPPGSESTFGLGNINFSAFLCPRGTETLIWGVGPALTFPTATAPQVGSQTTWGLGPTVAVFGKTRHWMLGVVANNVWSIAGDPANSLYVQYLVDYHLAAGFYLLSSPVITAKWLAPPGNKWVVPLGAVALNGNVSAFYNAVRPVSGPEWTLRTQLAMQLPRSAL
jgi:hypothetical protein